ncbi:twin-arginine translocase subunit TatC [Planotetraspora sp. A-T 1434]|uniref:twin-arginine translocase subunit TatC n=1 Tax=Planotetraspora sp. A-T 1434 TaxID=2979219 RepID=UPI0021C04084|nr:twin-arginine translocase subunit TatC [Planotetraspora sp. A-T 1434]MCT9934424.1 twin-arginine translocase subunit TatC [Planotetraspora sp. A-T 1434]
MALLKRSSPKAPMDDDGRMSLIDHIRELRNRLVKMILAVVLGTAVGFIFFTPIWNFMVKPFCRLPAAYRLDPTHKSCQLVVHGVLDGFMLNLQVALIFGAVVSAPIWIYQIWAFVTPGLYQNEKRYTLGFLGMSVPLFAAGATLAYLTMDRGLAILFNFVPDNTVPLLDVGDYVSFLTLMVVIFGISFLMPLLMAFLNVIGVLKFSTVAKHQRTVVFLLFVFAAVATPSQDPFTMLALAMPMVILFFVAEIFMYFHDKRRAAADAAHARAIEEELDGPSASTLDSFDTRD